MAKITNLSQGQNNHVFTGPNQPHYHMAKRTTFSQGQNKHVITGPKQPRYHRTKTTTLSQGQNNHVITGPKQPRYHRTKTTTLLHLTRSHAHTLWVSFIQRVLGNLLNELEKMRSRFTVNWNAPSFPLPTSPCPLSSSTHTHTQNAKLKFPFSPFKAAPHSPLTPVSFPEFNNWTILKPKPPPRRRRDRTISSSMGVAGFRWTTISLARSIN
ncbi:hypothetical protein BgiMline_012786 [Biomphalaria glabrata]